jgi:indole-3-glycerol phosphate synthase
MNFLEEMRESTAERVLRSRRETPEQELAEICDLLPPAPSFEVALKRSQADGIKVIAEVKRSSPSRGAIKTDLVVEDLVRAYEKGGADAISVLTEPVFFEGNLEDLERAGGAVKLPLLRKDFILDDYQLLEARARSASAVLLIVALLGRGDLERLVRRALNIGLTPLVEVHNEPELAAALEAGADVIGINNRDLKTLQVDMNTTARLLELMPDRKTVVSESGYREPAQVAEAVRLGIDAILVGEAFAAHEDPAAAIARFKDGNNDMG